jgi:chloride channel protein, CIC family
MEETNPTLTLWSLRQRTLQTWMKFRVWVSTLGEREAQLYLVLSLVIGALVGLMVVAFIVVTENLGSRMYPPDGPAWHRLVLPVAGALFSGFLLTRYFPDARGSGIPQTKTALFLNGGYIGGRTVVGRFLCSSISLASGLALGREGPSVQIGGGVSSIIGRRLGLSTDRIKALVPVGAAAALAAAFNTPIAAVLFSLEEILGDMHAPLLGSVVIGAATSWVTLHLFLGDEPLFHVPAYQLKNPGEFVAYALLGVIGGYISVAFTKLTLWLRLEFRKLPPKTVWLQPAAGGVLVGVLGMFVPQVLGVGYDYIGHVVNGNFLLSTAALLIVLKLVATAACYGSGNAGGIFGPSLFIGAMLGGTMGHLLHTWLPAHTSVPGAYALVGMGVTFAGIIRTPLTSVFMIFELTRDYSIVVPLMIANLTSFYISKRLQPKAIYEALAEQDGIHWPTAEASRPATRRTVRPLMKPAPAFVAPQTRLYELPEEPVYGLHFVGRDAELWGVLSKEDVKRTPMLEMAVEELLRAHPEDAMHLDGESFPHIHEDHPVELALERMAANGWPALPVVDRANVRRVFGVVEFDDVIASYRTPGKRQWEQKKGAPPSVTKSPDGCL